MPDREKVLNDLRELCEYLFHEYKVCYHGDEEDTYNRFLVANNALNVLKEQPEQKHGHWISFGCGFYRCSVCDDRKNMNFVPNYCSTCGAKMDEEVKQNG